MHRRIALVLGLLLPACGDSEEGPAEGPAEADPFDDSLVAEYDLTMAPADWDAIVADPHDNTWREATLRWRGETYERVAVRPAGERSRIPGNPKPSIRLEFDVWLADREFHRFSTIKLDSLVHDPAMMKARLQYPVYAALGIPSPRCVHATLVVNGSPKGLYLVEERLGREFLRKRLGEPVNQLYEFSEGRSDLDWMGDELWRYVPSMWIPKIDDLPADPETVRELTDVLHHRPAEIPAWFDVDAFARFMAAEMITGEGDGYLAGPDGEDAENLFMTRSPKTGLFMLIPWDRDQGFHRDQDDASFGFERQILTLRMIAENPQGRDRYFLALRELLAGAWATDRVVARIDAVWTQVRDAVAADPLKAWSAEEVAAEVEDLKAYVRRRNAAFAAQLP